MIINYEIFSVAIIMHIMLLYMHKTYFRVQFYTLDLGAGLLLSGCLGVLIKCRISCPQVLAQCPVVGGLAGTLLSARYSCDLNRKTSYLRVAVVPDKFFIKRFWWMIF